MDESTRKANEQAANMQTLMVWMEVGVVKEGPPYDFDELLRLCAA